MGDEASVWRPRSRVRLAGAVIVALASAIVGVAPAAAGTLTVNVDAWHNGAGCGLFYLWGSVNNFSYDAPCNGYPMALAGPSNGSVSAGTRIGYQTNPPAGITITNANVVANTIDNLNNGKGWGGGGYWAGGGHEWINGDSGETDGPFSSGYWGFSIVCGWSSCSNYAAITLSSIQLTASETRGPGLLAFGSNNLWYQGEHWIWNAPGNPWPITLAASDPSGVCGMFASVNNVESSGPTSLPNTSQWQQCPDPTWTPTSGASVNTRDYVAGAGPLSLQLGATNAAGVQSVVSETLQVDNDPVQLSLSGPTTASTTAGTQDVTATASAGPSGVAIGCSLDGGPEQWQNGTVDRVAVSGAGNHTVSCRAHNGAIDPQGQYAYSSTQSWSLDIGQPTVSAIGFSKVVDQLRCRRVRERIKIPAHLVTMHRHHKLVRIHVRGRTKVEKVERCHPRIVWRREPVWVTVRRHGKPMRVKRMKRVPVALSPHAVVLTKKRVLYGSSTTVSGWLGTTSSIAVGGQPVRIIAAPDNGSGQFTQVATAVTTADGRWTAQIGSGPSRVIEALYDGSPTLLPTTSAAIRTVVPAKVKIRIAPTIVPWGSVIRITGRVLGGYVPTNSNLLRLNVGIGRIGHLEGLPQIQPDGRFLILWKFNAGQGVLHPWFSVGTLSESAFPYGSGGSRRLTITLGEPTPPAAAAHPRQHDHHRAKRHKSRRRRRRKG